jgi:outer membrane receptor for monomeric catechols
MKSSNLLTVSAAWLGFLLGSSLQAQTAPSAASASPKAADEPTTLSVFTVSEEKNVGYSSMQTTAGMRTVQELKNVANSISVVNSELIADIGATNLAGWFGRGQPVTC